jgi:hypothetical protein
MASRLGIAFLVTLVLLPFAGCTSATSKFMQRVDSVPTSPAPGTALVFIHRPRAYGGHGLQANVWDGRSFIADIGAGHTAYYECAPGRHRFICRSVEKVSVVEADLAAGQVYDLKVSMAFSWWIQSFEIEPIGKDDKRRAEIAPWMKKHRLHKLNPGSTDSHRAYETKWASEIDTILQNFCEGKDKHRLQHLAADEHR